MTFVEAVESRNIKNIQAFAKTDLHNHACLGGNREYFKTKLGKTIPLLDNKLMSMSDMHKWVADNLSFLFDSREMQRLAIDAAFAQAKEDGISTIEFGEDVWGNGQYYENNIDLLISNYVASHSEIAPETDFSFQIGISRHCPINLIQEWMAPFLERDCFSSVDLYGDELSQPVRNFKPIYRNAKSHGLLLKAHAGEWGNADSVKEAVEELELDEVQHGISAAKSPSVTRWLSANGIQLNICPTSNVLLDRVADYRSHPIRVLYDNGVKVTINSDDVLVFGKGVSDEYLNLFTCGLFSAKELDNIRLTGLESRKHKDR